jgi:F-type H+-transporting ATPase subunit b
VLHIQLSTIVFQIVNFLILLAALSWLFYRPINRVMRSREEGIAARLREADQSIRSAEKERDELAKRAREADAAAQSLLASARMQAGEERRQIIVAARTDAARLVAEAQQTIQEQERSALGRLDSHIRESAISVAGSLIREAAGTQVHEQLLRQFLEQGVRPTNPGEVPFVQALAQDHNAITIELAYPAVEAAETAIRDVLSREFTPKGVKPQITFVVSPALLAGLRILAGEFVLDLSLRRALQTLKAGESARGEEV